MPAVKHPCTQCKEKHVKCDEERPKCQRCQIKALPCTRPVKKTVFKHGSVASFSRDQKWVNSEARHFRYHARGGTAAREPMSPDQSASPSWSTMMASAEENRNRRASFPQEGKLAQPSPDASSDDSQAMDADPKDPSALDAATLVPGLMHHSDSFGSDRASQLQTVELSSKQESHFVSSLPQVGSNNLYGGSQGGTTPPSVTQGYTDHSPHARSSSIAYTNSTDGDKRAFPLENVQEACLLRYWTEEISHWVTSNRRIMVTCMHGPPVVLTALQFDLCDESRHFHLVVPARAREHPHLLNAVFAVAARHLCRLPQYKTPQGILYHGQLLPHLDEHSAVEYMLHCMPALRQFHHVQDDDYRDSIVATAVILRQLEEIDNEDDQLQLSGQPSTVHPGAGKRVNFLAIIDAVLRSLPSQSVFGRRSLMQASYWMALRQEVYHSFTRLEAPQLILPPEFWHIASPANKSVMHLVQVAKWKWGDYSTMEWSRLMDQQEHLEKAVLADIQPLFRRPADKALGEIFPTVWYRSNIEVTSIQFSLLAKSVLVAENPQLRLYPSSRSSWRQVENDVRLLLLEQSGIALCNPASPPALVHAAFGIQVYGDFFTDHYERRAIRTMVERYRDTHAWPVQRLLNMFR